MGKWIQRGIAAAIFALFALWAPGGRSFLFFGSYAWWFCMCFGVLIIWGAEWLDSRMGSTAGFGAEYCGIVKLLGWGFLGAPVVWSLYLWSVMPD